MFYDLHIHSCLSPCAEREMSIHNILNMCVIKGLDVISITDHNSMRQYRYFKEVAKQFAIRCLFGVEVQTIEDIHVCCYFRTEEDMDAMAIYLRAWHPNIQNKVAYFGEQILLDALDQPYGQEDNLLLVSLNVSINELCDVVHELHGAVVLAHVIHRSYGICTQLGFIPENLMFDGIEIRTEIEKQLVQEKHPWIRDTVWLINSDAHRLVDIQEAIHQISEEELAMLWRKSL